MDPKLIEITLQSLSTAQLIAKLNRLQSAALMSTLSITRMGMNSMNASAFDIMPFSGKLILDVFVLEELDDLDEYG